MQRNGKELWQKCSSSSVQRMTDITKREKCIDNPIVTHMDCNLVQFTGTDKADPDEQRWATLAKAPTHILNVTANHNRWCYLFFGKGSYHL